MSPNFDLKNKILTWKTEIVTNVDLRIKTLTNFDLMKPKLWNMMTSESKL